MSYWISNSIHKMSIKPCEGNKRDQLVFPWAHLVISLPSPQQWQLALTQLSTYVHRYDPTNHLKNSPTVYVNIFNPSVGLLTRWADVLRPPTFPKLQFEHHWTWSRRCCCWWSSCIIFTYMRILSGQPTLSLTSSAFGIFSRKWQKGFHHHR